jgi:glutamate/tyrosine decarboxylase-like PLP-dependent enzyme
MGGKSEFSFYKNEYSDNYDVVDYKDWTIGLVRRNYAMHFYYLYSHYGIDKLKDAIESLQLKTEYLEELVASRSDLFEVRFKGYSLLSFRLVGNSDKSSNSLTKLLGLAIKNTEDGFSTPSSAKG